MRQEPANEYNARVNEWLTAHGITFTITRIGSEQGFNGEPDGLKGERLMHDTYTAAFKRARMETTGRSGAVQVPVERELVVPKFYQAAAHSESAIKLARCNCPGAIAHRNGCAKDLRQAEIPSAYTILSGLTKYDPGTFADFCAEYGYDTDSRRAERTYFAVQEEWKRVEAFFTAEEREDLREVAS